MIAVSVVGKTLAAVAALEVVALAMDPTVRGAAIGIGISVVGGTIVALVKRGLDRRDRSATDNSASKSQLAHEARGRDEAITELRSKVATLDKMVEPFWLAAQKNLVKDLTHFHTPRSDYLLTLLGPPWQGTPEEETELWAWMDERIETLNGRIDDDEKDSATILRIVARKARAELKSAKDPTTPDTVLQVVAVPPPETPK